MAHPIRRLAAPAALSALALVCSAAPAFAAGAPPGGDGSLDVRDSSFLAEPPASITARADALRASLGDQGVVELDAISQTPRFVAKLDGYLSGPSAASAPQVALGYVRAHSALFGLDAADLASLKLARERVTPDGVHHVVFAQTVDGIPVFDRDLRANVAADGRLVNVLGAPLRDLALPSTTPALSAAAALRSAMASVGGTLVPVTAQAAGDAQQTTAFSDGSDARLTIFPSASGPRLAWRLVLDQDSQHLWHTVVDATSGDVLYRENLVKFAAGTAWSYFPGPLPFNNGGVPSSRDFTPWLGSASSLSGPNAHVYMDVNDDGAPGPADEIPPSSGTNWNYAFTTFAPFFGGCDSNFLCSWDGGAASSWITNAYQNATQVFYFVNNFHDYLENDPNIQFGNASGNFEGADPVQAQTLDGANLASGFPDGHHINNANMSTREDGVPPRMQMYLFNEGGFIDANGGDDASVIYHEYVHGLSARLVTDAAGFPALRGGQSGAMGEAWSDWYAMDYLMLQGFDQDNAPVDVNVGCYVSHCGNVIRSEPLDCKVGSAAGDCPGGQASGPGGYTYGDYGRISSGGPEVHADGEIWAQTLWDLRPAIGPDAAQQVITRGMDLSPPAPSMLDMRNAIIQADIVNFGGSHVPAIWSTFAARGMGWFASTLSSSDSAPVESFALPPGGALGQITGTVSDADTAAAVGSATVRVAGHASGFASDLAATSAASGAYAITGVPGGTYPQVLAQAAGYEPSLASNVSAPAGGAARVDFRLKRDYAALSGGAIVRSVTPPDLSAQGCGPAGAFDISLGTAWGSTSPASTQGPGGPKAVVLELPLAVNVATYMIDPGAGCGDDDGAATAGFTVETSTDGVTYAVSASGTFAAANNHKLNPVTPTAGTQGVRFIRLTMLNQQNPATPSGKDFMDLSEFEIYGLPTPGQSGGGGGGGGTKDTKAPQGRFALFGKKPKLGAALKSGVKIRVRCNEACTATPSLLLSVKQAKKLKLGRTVTVALSGKIAANKYRVFTVKFTAKAKTKLKKLKTVTLTMALGVKDAAGNKARGTSSLTLKR